MEYVGFNGHRLAYTVHGDGHQTTVLLPGLLLSQEMQIPLARTLAARGNRVVTLDLLGHGHADRPEEMWHYSMSAFAEQTVALLDDLGLERAIVGGTSLGANLTLEVASTAGERLHGMIIEMPVLDHAIPACGVAFTPLLRALKLGAPVMSAVARAARAIPRQPLPFLARIGVDCVAPDPAPSAAVLSGILYGRVAPDHNERRTLKAPALLIGHPRDPVHPFSDAGMLASELPNARLVHASSLLELRVRPKRLTGKIAAFIAECWAASTTAGRRGGAARRGSYMDIWAATRPFSPPTDRLRDEQAQARRRPSPKGFGLRGGHSHYEIQHPPHRGRGGPGGSTMSRPVGARSASSSSCQK